VKQSKALFFSIIVGVVAYPIFSYATPLIPWILFGMLFVTYTRLDLRALRVEPIHLKLLLVQSVSVALCMLLYFTFILYTPLEYSADTHLPIHQMGFILSEGALICFLAPTALSAAVITATMGGSLSRLLTYTFITNIGIAIIAPLIFTIVGTSSITPVLSPATTLSTTHPTTLPTTLSTTLPNTLSTTHPTTLSTTHPTTLSTTLPATLPNTLPATSIEPQIPALFNNFFHTFATLLWKVIPMLLFPFIAALLCRWLIPSVFRFVEKRQSISFYLWVVGVTLIMARTTKSVVDHGWIHWKTELALAFIALVVAVIQFKIGRRLGRKYSDPISAGQALGQKNTILAIWMAQSFLHPLAVLAPASYVLWQNLINSYQLHRVRRD
jgi:hypothetical protein